MSKKNRQLMLLAGLTLIVLVIAWRQLGPKLGGGDSGRTSVGSMASRSMQGGPGRSTGPLPEVEELRLSDLQEASGELSAGRNPFQIESPPPPRIQTSRSDSRVAPEKVPPRASPRPGVTKGPPKPTPPPVDVVFLGSFGPEAKRLAVFTDGQEIYNVPEGEVLKDRFVVVRVGFESADLGFLGFPEAPAQRLEIGG